LDDEGWWKGELGGRVGVFPDNFVEEIVSNEKTTGPNGKPIDGPPTRKTGKQLELSIGRASIFYILSLMVLSYQRGNEAINGHGCGTTACHEQAHVDKY
jgi:hypothetical protein